MGIPSFEELKRLQAGAEEERKAERRKNFAADMAELSLMACVVAIKSMKLDVSLEDAVEMFKEQWNACLVGQKNLVDALIVKEEGPDLIRARGQKEENDGHQSDPVPTVQAEPPSK